MPPRIKSRAELLNEEVEHDLVIEQIEKLEKENRELMQNKSTLADLNNLKEDSNFRKHLLVMLEKIGIAQE